MRRKLPIALTAGALLLTAPLAAQADPGTATDHLQKVGTGAVKIDTDFVANGANPDKVVKAIVELKDEPVAVEQATKGRKLTNSEKTAITNQIKTTQQPVVNTVKSKGGRVDAQMQSAYNGVKVEVKQSDIAALAALPNVVAIHKVSVVTINNATSVPFLGAPTVWQDTGYLGEGVKVAVIDTGIDYTHADFAGPGTKAAYDAAKAAGASPADPALFGPNSPRIKGGIDLVGDDYNANKAGSVPKPDPNPLDCQGHGSHVAGTIGGGGVTADGKAYTGPYNKATAAKKWTVGPGVAPKADLYAVRVFGCAGSTDVTTEALDWAVQNNMDVINMSLGSPYGQAGDPSAVAASNAAAAGIVVVASAGNAGHNPYLVGSPSVGKGVISVAANDSTASFPGATLTSGSTTISAINANGATLPTTPYTVVVLKDDPATAENEALGCSVAAYTKNGIAADANAPAQIAVTTRGSCARAARPVFGQQAGADAVVMINTSPDYPPFEGTITENPDDGTKFDVTIPFLGVKSTDGAALSALNGQTLTLADTPLQNPSFRKAASFTSGGAASGDSSLRPGVTAPGVSIVSAGVGTGNGNTTMSGTSMAAPHVAGVAALARQAHPKWNSREITNLIISGADASGLNDYNTVLEGNGLVDLAQSVTGQVYATGDTWKNNNDTFREPSLSFGFKEIGANGYTATKKVQLVNKGNTAQTFTLKNVASPESLPAKVTVSPSKVTLKPGAKATVNVTLTVQQKNVPGSQVDAQDQYNFHAVDGRIVATSASETVAVPYLLVPRSSANLTVKTSGALNQKKGPLTLTLSNKSTAQSTSAEIFTLGIVDPKGEPSTYGVGGVDLKAAGVESIAQGDDAILVFALASHTRYSNAASLEYDVLIDTNGDGKNDWLVFSYDQGAVVNDDPNGVTEVFLQNLSTGGTYRSGFLATAPTDSNTVMLPVLASDLGITKADSPRFSYTVQASSIIDTAVQDQGTGKATYNPWLKPINDGAYLDVKAGGTVKTTLTVNQAAWNQQKPLGALVVAYDNPGKTEAIVVLGK